MVRIKYFMFDLLCVLVVLSIGLGLGSCAASAPPAAAGVRIPPEVLALCREEGGCTLISNARLEQMIEDQAAQFCRGRT